MLIKKITLHKFKRFALSNIDHFEYVPKSNINIFTDRNGAGKSSLLSQLNPLPADIKKDFKDDGYKQIELTHNGSNYVILSKGSKHSILKDNQELNPGGTRKVQLELIESIFNITPNSLNVINGNTPFTIMSQSERKRWLTEISTVDYSYPISIFQKLQERRRDLSAWVKLYNEKIVSITTYINSIQDYESILNMDNAIRTTIEKLLKEYIPSPSTDGINSILERLKNKNREFQSLSYILNIDLPKDIKTKEELTQQLSIKHHELKKNLETLSHLQKDGDKELLEIYRKKLEEVNKTLQHLPSMWNLSNLNSIFYHLRDKMDVLQSIHSELIQLTLPKDLDIEKLERDIIEKKTFISKIEVSLNKQNHIASEFTSIQNISLPSCKHCGNPYEIDSLLSNTKNNITLLTERLDKEKKEVQELERVKSIHNRNQYLLNSLKGILDTDEYIKTSYTFLGLDRPTEISLDGISSTIEVIGIVTGKIKDVFIPTLEEKENINRKLVPLLETSLLSREEKINNLKLIQSIVDELQTNINSIQSRLKEIDINIQTFERIKRVREEIKDLLKQVNEERKVAKIKLENEFIENTISKLKEKNIENVKILEQYRSSQKELEAIKKDKSKVEREAYLISKLMDVLSPTSGLIAKSINSFLGVFINDINIIINSVWSYKLKVIPCDIFEGDDLDYKFRVEVNDSFIVDDISKLSSSMREIVDLAFRLVFIKYKNLDKIPIILDEFGRTMDKEHRISAFNMVDQIIANNFDQVFLVSHFEEMYGRFKNADFPVIQ